MSSNGSSVVEQTPVETIFQNVLSSSSDEPPIEEWSSLIIITPPDSPKRTLYKEGLYDPGSGEICGKYIPMSDSTVLRHSYYAYPGVKDPGIMEALEGPEPKKIYDYVGQELYLDLCKQMDVVPVRSFYRGLLNEVIDLRYYCVNPVGVRAMCLSLVSNRFVRRLDLTDNHLSNDAFYHLGLLLGDSFALQELVLSGCRAQAQGMQRLVAMLSNRTLELLDLSKNDIGDEGFFYLADQLTKGAVIKRLNLSNNKLTGAAALAFAEAIEFNNTITHLDISWNNMFPLKGSNDLLRILSESTELTELNVSWNSLTTGIVLRKLISIPTLQVLDISNNRLTTAAVKAIVGRLHVAKRLHTLDLSHNPIGPADAFTLVSKMRDKKVRLKNLLMEDVAVTKEFVVECEDILSYDYRKKTTITYGRVIRDYTLSQPDLREIVMKRIDFITARATNKCKLDIALECEDILSYDYRKKTTITYGRVIRDYSLSQPDLREIVMKRIDFITAKATKKCKLDIALYFLREHKQRPYLQPRELMKALKTASAPVDEGLMNEVANCFPGPKTDKGGAQINLAGVVEYIKRLWPDKKLPPTPPLPPEPQPLKESKKKK